MPDPVEVTKKYVTTVDDLTQAWAFVMERVDQVGTSPHIEIRPISTIGVADMLDGLGDSVDSGGGWVRRFEVVVSGVVEEATD